MKFNNISELKNFLKKYKKIGEGSEGIVYYDKSNNCIYKIFSHIFSDELNYCHLDSPDCIDICNVMNETYIFPTDMIVIDNYVVGYVEKYVKGEMLSLMSPLNIELSNYIDAVMKGYNDTLILSYDSIMSNDVAYNTLYDGKTIKIIDTESYIKSSCDEYTVVMNNLYNYYRSTVFFLVSSYLEEFIKSKSSLNDIYNNKFSNPAEFLNLLRYLLSEYVGHEINYLYEAKKAFNKKNNHDILYLRYLK